MLQNSLAHQSSSDRRRTNSEIWRLQGALGLLSGYFSDSGQDMVLDQHVFKGKRNGIFVEVGGNDGRIGSTSLFFELRRYWDGLLIDANPAQLAKAAAFRRCKCLQAVVAPTEGTATFLNLGSEGTPSLGSGLKETLPAVTTSDPRFSLAERSEIEVQTRTLPDLLQSENTRKIDYLALDVEGVEFDILGAFPFDQFEIGAISVENHDQAPDMQQLLETKGFELIECLGFDEIYVHRTIGAGIG